METTTVGAYEAKTHLPRLLEAVEAGASFTITKHGREVARLVPVGAPRRATTELIAALRTARVGVRRGEDSVADMIKSGRR